MGLYVASIFAHANSMGSWSSKLILLNLKYFIKIQSKTYFCSSKTLKRCTFTKHRCTFVAKVRIQSCFIKNHIKWQIWMYFFSYFLKKLRESQLLKQKTPMGYGYISYFLSNRNAIFYEFSWLALHIPSPPACTEDIVHVHYK